MTDMGSKYLMHSLSNESDDGRYLCMYTFFLPKGDGKSERNYKTLNSKWDKLFNDNLEKWRKMNCADIPIKEPNHHRSVVNHYKFNCECSEMLKTLVDTINEDAKWKINNGQSKIGLLFIYCPNPLHTKNEVKNMMRRMADFLMNDNATQSATTICYRHGETLEYNIYKEFIRVHPGIVEVGNNNVEKGNLTYQILSLLKKIGYAFYRQKLFHDYSNKIVLDKLDIDLRFEKME